MQGSNLGRSPQYVALTEREFGTLEELFAAGEAVRQLLEHPGWSHVTALIGREIATIDQRLDQGGEPLSRAAYALAHGRRGGLKAVLDAPTSIVGLADRRLAEQQAKHNGSGESGQGS